MATIGLHCVWKARRFTQKLKSKPTQLCNFATRSVNLKITLPLPHITQNRL